MAQQEEEKKQSSPVDTATDAVRMGMKMKGKGAAVRMGAQLAARASVALAPAAAAAAPFILIAIAIIVVVLIIVIFIVVILVAIGVIGGGGSTAFASGSGLGIKPNYCQAFLSPEDLDGDGELDDCSIVLKGIILEAASSAKMPAGVLVAFGLSENLMDVMQITEVDITRYSDPGAVLPDGGEVNTVGKCATSSAGARGVMQFIPSTFEGHKDFIVDVGARLDGYESKICNIKDSLFAAAHKIKEDSGIPFNETARPWTPDEVYDAAIGYNPGACSSPSSVYCARIQDFYVQKKDEGVGPGGLACFQFSNDDGNPDTIEIPWQSGEQSEFEQAIRQLSQSSQYIQLLCNGGPVELFRHDDDYSRRIGRSLYLRDYSSSVTRLFVLTHESVHVITGENPGLVNDFINSGAFESDGGIIPSYPIDLGCALDGDVPPNCYTESIAEASGWYVVDGSYTSRVGVIDLQVEYPNHFNWVMNNIFGGHVFTF